MFSANNFYQWTYETYLKDKVFSMLTYHPFGSRGYKNLQKWDLDQSADCDINGFDFLSHSSVLMNDQEPVLLDSMTTWKKEHTPDNPFDTIIQIYQRIKQDADLWHSEADKAKWEKEKHKFKNTVEHFLSITDDISFMRLMFPGILKPILVHSELHSQDVKQLTQEFIPVYVFWHGLISRDWYRHWRHNRKCTPDIKRANADKRFLLYARAWTGSRAYRLNFVEQIIKEDLYSNFKYNFFELDNGYYYREYTDIDIASYFPPTEKNNSTKFVDQILLGHAKDNQKPTGSNDVTVSSDSSAYIDVNDYESTSIQIVAETLFDTEKIHLTEKTFQPIVAGQPFLTLAPPGTLKTLRYYGFHTFDHVWDESYDSIVDPDKRMQAVVEQIKKLNALDAEQFNKVYEKCLAVCEHNKQHFFSDSFEQQILTEYDHNFKRAFEQQQEIALKDPGGSRFWIADEICFNCYQTDFFYEKDQFYLKYLLSTIKEYSEEQYQAILKQYWWAQRLEELS